MRCCPEKPRANTRRSKRRNGWKIWPTAAGTNLDQARQQMGAGATKPAFRRVEEDVLIQRGLALFFAAKLRSAVLWRIYTQTGHRAAGEAAIARYVAGRDAWAAMAERAKTVYRDDISYGGSRHQRSLGGSRASL